LHTWPSISPTPYNAAWVTSVPVVDLWECVVVISIYTSLTFPVSQLKVPNQKLLPWKPRGWTVRKLASMMQLYIAKFLSSWKLQTFLWSKWLHEMYIVLQRLSTFQYLGILQLTKSDQQNYKGKKTLTRIPIRIHLRQPRSHHLLAHNMHVIAMQKMDLEKSARLMWYK